MLCATLAYVRPFFVSKKQIEEHAVRAGYVNGRSSSALINIALRKRMTRSVKQKVV